MDANKVIYSVIAVVLLFLVAAAVIPTLGTASETLGNTSDLPLASIFAENGVIILIFMAALVIAAVSFFKLKKH